MSSYFRFGYTFTLAYIHTYIQHMQMMFCFSSSSFVLLLDICIFFLIFLFVFGLILLSQLRKFPHGNSSTFHHHYNSSRGIFFTAWSGHCISCWLQVRPIDILSSMLAVLAFYPNLSTIWFLAIVTL